MKLSRTLSIAALIFIGAINVNGQNQIHLSQYMFHQPFLNPASMGGLNEFNAALLHRNQWSGVNGAPKISGANTNLPVGTSKLHRIGFTFLSDKIGVNTTTNIGLSYAFKMKFSESTSLSLGATAGTDLMKSELSNVIVTENNDPIYSGNTPMFVLPSLKFGAYFRTKDFYAGFAIPNLLKNEVKYVSAYEGQTSFDITNLHYYLHLGYRYELNNELAILSSALIKEVVGSPMQFDLNLKAMFNEKFGVGISYRTPKKLVALFDIQLHSTIRLGVAYDYNFNEIRDFTFGTAEVMLIYTPKLSSAQPIIMSPRY